MNEIVFKRLELDNFMSFERLELDLEDGTFLVLGENEDSLGADNNGGGKSAPFEGFRWTLYGRTMRQDLESLTSEHVVRNEARFAHGKLVFDANGKEVCVERHRTRSGGNVTVQVSGSKKSKGKEAEKVIEETLGVDLMQFANLVHLCGEYPKLFARAGDQGRKSILAELVELAVVQEMQEEAKRRLAEAQSAADALEKEDADLVEERARLVAERKELRDGGAGAREELQELCGRREELGDLVARLESGLEKARADQAGLATERDAILAGREKADRAYEKAREEHDQTLTGLDEALQSARDEVDAAQGSREDLEEQRSTAEATLRESRDELEEQLRVEKSELQKAVDRQLVLRDQAESALDEVRGLIEAGQCPTCRQETTAKGMSSETERLDKIATDHQSALDEARAAVEEAAKRGGTRLGEADRDTEEAVGRWRVRLEEVDDVVTAVKGKAEAAKVALDEAREGGPERPAVDEVEEARLRTVNRDIKRHGEDIDQIVEDLGESRVKFARAEASAEALKKRLEEDETTYNAKGERREEIDGRREELAEELLDARALVDDLEFWKEGFSSRGVPSLYVETILPRISERIQKYADVLSGGDIRVDLKAFKEQKSGTIKEAIQIQARNMWGADVYGGNSRGEKHRVDVAVTLGLVEYFRDLGVFSCNLLVCDEVFDGLDRTGVERALQALALSHVSSVWVMSHHPHLASLFERSWLATKARGVSTMAPFLQDVA